MIESRCHLSADMFRQLHICVVVPTYNNAGTIQGVLEEVLRYVGDVVVVNDGSTDSTARILERMSGEVTVVSYPNNRGKGYALKTGLLKARELGFKYAVTIDSDGQHFPEDLLKFAEALRLHPGAMVVGSRGLDHENMPEKNKFANNFSNFWFRLQTGVRLSDTQTGYRLYPLRRLYGLRLLTSRYEAELELLVYAAWHGVELVEIPVRVYYPPEGERVSHFRPFVDFARISLLNSALCFFAVVYGLPLRLWRKLKRKK